MNSSKRLNMWLNVLAAYSFQHMISGSAGLMLMSSELLLMLRRVILLLYEKRGSTFQPRVYMT